MANEVTDLATLGDLAPSLTVPKSVDLTDNTGAEGIRLDEVRFPQLAIAQGLSKQVIPTEGNFIKGLSMGDMFNDLTSEIYGNGPLTIVPVLRHVTRIEFDPNDQSVPLDREVPWNDPRMKWQGNEPPRATEFVEFVSLLLRPKMAPERIIVSIKTTNKHQRAAARDLTTWVNSGGPIYSRMFHIKSRIEKGKNKKGEETVFGVFGIKFIGFVPDSPAGKALKELAASFRESIQDKTIVTDREPGADDFNPSELEGGGAGAEM
jgi:hypothetical protein